MPQYQTYTPAVPDGPDILAFYKSSVGLMRTCTFAQFAARVYAQIALNFANAAVFPNTVPTPGQVLIGNAGGTGYHPATIGGDLQVTDTGAATIKPKAVSFGKLQDISAPGHLIGRGSLLGPGVPQEIDLGFGLMMVGTTLHVNAGIGNVLQLGDATQAGKVFVSGALDKTRLETPVKISPIDGEMYGFRQKVLVKPTDEVLSPEDSGAVISNEGAGPMPTYTLPQAEPGLAYTFIVEDNAGFRVQAVGLDRIRVGAGQSSPSGTARTSAIGDSLVLVAQNGVSWTATASRGTFLFT